MSKRIIDGRRDTALGPKGGRVLITSESPPRRKLAEPKVDFQHLPTESQILRAMSSKQRRAYDRATKAQRRKMLGRHR